VALRNILSSESLVTDIAFEFIFELRIRLVSLHVGLESTLPGEFPVTDIAFEFILTPRIGLMS